VLTVELLIFFLFTDRTPFTVRHFVRLIVSLSQKTTVFYDIFSKLLQYLFETGFSFLFSSFSPLFTFAIRRPPSEVDRLTQVISFIQTHFSLRQVLFGPGIYPPPNKVTRYNRFPAPGYFQESTILLSI